METCWRGYDGRGALRTYRPIQQKMLAWATGKREPWQHGQTLTISKEVKILAVLGWKQSGADITRWLLSVNNRVMKKAGKALERDGNAPTGENRDLSPIKGNFGGLMYSSNV